MSENRMEIVGVDLSVLTIPLFRVDVPSSSERVRFPTKFPRPEPDDKVELGEVFGPADLPAGKNLSSGKVLEILMISDHVYGVRGTLKVVTPMFKGFENG